jgi:hypothetical protein
MPDYPVSTPHSRPPPRTQWLEIMFGDVENGGKSLKRWGRAGEIADLVELTPRQVENWFAKRNQLDLKRNKAEPKRGAAELPPLDLQWCRKKPRTQRARTQRRC